MGPGVQALMAENGLRQADLLEGGRYHAELIEHAGIMKEIKRIAGLDNARSACPEALERYGPSGTIGRSLVIAR
ncbi:hypothetical protein C2U72_20775 [Prosthecomicrobium hirschii]|nr:hypothetical protein C2U72_20775 [Prosthecomicrobium hirschii]